MIDPIVLQKYCSQCLADRPRSRFSPSSQTKDGLMCWCKDCRNKIARAVAAAARPSDGMFRCRRCGIVRPLNEIDPQITSYCTPCVAVIRLEQPAEKPCRRCGAVKSLSQFYQQTNTRKGFSAQCKKCRDKTKTELYQRSAAWRANVARRGRHYRQTNPEKIRDRNKRYQNSEGYKAMEPIFKRKRSDAQVKRKYGITPGQFEQMMRSQGGVCAICLQPPRGKRVLRLHIDHSHADGTVRGLLCNLCNAILGRWKDSPETADRAAAYLRRHAQLKLVV